MANAAPFQRLSRLSWPQRLLLAEALVTLAAVSAAIRVAPFKRVVMIAGSAKHGRSQEHDESFVRQARWAVQALADRVPWRAVCFQRGLALHLILRRRGVPSLLHYGVSQTAERGLTAHVWISVHDQPVLGGEEAGSYACLATFPATEPNAI